MFHPSDEDERAWSPVEHAVPPPTRSQSLCLPDRRKKTPLRLKKRSKSCSNLPASEKDDSVKPAPKPASPFFSRASISTIHTKRGFAHMTALEKRILQRRLRRDSLNLADSFGFIHMGVQSYLLDTSCTIPQLMSCIMEVPIMRVGHLRRMRRSTSISGIFLELIVKNLISFLQFSVIKHLLNTLCSEADSLRDKMAVYEKDYYEYMVKRFFFNNSGAYRVKKRSDSESDSDDEEEEEMAEILVITDDIWEGNIPFVRISDIEAVVTRAYDIGNFSLELASF